MSWILWYKNIDLVRKNISNKLMVFGSDRKDGGILPFGEKMSCRVLRHREGGRWKEALIKSFLVFKLQV